jgi:5-methylcytosine-specific restriction protein B
LNNTGEKDDRWIGLDFESGISVDKWLKLFEDESIFNVQSWEILYRLLDYGGMASCKQLAVKYGENNNFYNNGATALARRVADKVGCDIQVREKDGSKRYWVVLFNGRKTNDDEEGSFVWKLRDELAEALKTVDFSKTDLYANPIGTEFVDTYTQNDFLAEVYMENEEYETLKGLFLNKKNIILQGAPGVGKTFAAKRLAYSIMGMKDDSRVVCIQFHQNYSYEDFIMGYKPSGDGFELQDGIFYKFCQKAANSPDKPYFFIIDEINRGNMSKIFGELLMLIEKDYRGTKLTLAYNGLAFSVPQNLYIIGMMNTADRSLAMIDYALRRRFSFFDMEPGFNSDGFMEYMNSFDNDTFVSLIERVKELNVEIADDPALGKGFCIGHSYFCGQEVCSEEWMQSVVEYDILPMLAEYWFDEPAKLQKWQNILRSVFND